jgi:hypothetical protein
VNGGRLDVEVSVDLQAAKASGNAEQISGHSADDGTSQPVPGGAGLCYFRGIRARKRHVDAFARQIEPQSFVVAAFDGVAGALNIIIGLLQKFVLAHPLLLLGQWTFPSLGLPNIQEP